jgi:DNA-binding CsgD family transcriptional regulator
VHSDTGHIEATVSTPSGFSVYAFENHAWVKKLGQLMLTEGERTMLYLSAQGYTMSQIGEKMYRSVDTVKMYRKHVFDKLGVTNISEAIAYAYNYNLL